MPGADQRLYRLGKRNPKKLKLPEYPFGEKNNSPSLIHTAEESIIHRYTGLDFSKIQKLSIFEYQLYLRDGYIYSLSGSEEGRKYLKNAARMEITEPDREAWRKFMAQGVSGIAQQ